MLIEDRSYERGIKKERRNIGVNITKKNSIINGGGIFNNLAN